MRGKLHVDENLRKRIIYSMI